jgi:hypothetical protein
MKKYINDETLNSPNPADHKFFLTLKKTTLKHKYLKFKAVYI